MRKFTIAFLLSLCATCSLAAIGCKDRGSSGTGNGGQNGGNNSPIVPVESHTLTFNAGEGYKIVGDGVTFDETNGVWVAKAEKNSTFTFSLDLGAFYTDTSASVTAGGVALTQTDGKYALSVTGDCEISISGVKKAKSAMAGSGAFDDAYVVTQPIDLVYIAEQVNAGKGNYATASYVIASDIDCKGEELQVIGTAENPFSGCFTCLTNSETGQMERFAISNFKINANDKNYVGLFGCVQIDLSVQSSGLFYGIRLDNFEINASTSKLDKSNRNIYCGSLFGYGLGTRAYLCDATNGTINLSADPTEFSFVGGLMGVQQSVYMADYEQSFNAETAYANVDVDVNVVSGTTLYAGGIAGYLYTNSYICPSYIHNSYSTGNVSGAIRTGGIAGGLGQYSSIATCYSSGNVTANVAITSQTDGYLPEHCIAYAGGIVGFAENDTVVNDCFAVGTITAKAVDGPSAQKTHHAIGGGDEDGKISVAARKYVVRDCLSAIDKATMKDTLTALGWQTYNWIFPDNGYPVINYEPSDEQSTVTTTVQFIDKTGKAVSVNKATETDYSYSDMYAPIASAFVDGFLDIYLTADDKVSLSFGYYFDKECTQPVPYSYLSTRNMTLYMGFTNPAEILGTYTLAVNTEKPLTITFNADGTASYVEGGVPTTLNYQYDGATLLLDGARLARYFTGAINKDETVNEDTLFDMYRYDAYYFQAVKTKNGFDLYDGKYFTADKPLKAYAPTQFTKLGAYFVDMVDYVDEYVFLPDGTGTKNGRAITYTFADNVLTIDNKTTIAIDDLKAYAPLKGTWQKTAFSGKTFEFDGIDTFKAYTNVYKRNMNSGSISSDRQNLVEGKFETADGVTYTLKVGNEAYASATFDEFGFLTVTYSNGTIETYSANGGSVGKWQGSDIELQLLGINQDGVGEAKAVFTRLSTNYDLTYSLSETANYLCLYYDNTLFGYFTFDAFNNGLQITIFDPSSMEGEYVTTTLRLVNDFDNIWISNNETFDDISFNGVGYFNENGNWSSTVKIGNDRVPYVLYDGGTNGYFDYQGNRYTLSYDDVNNQITINTDIMLERKDELTNIDFVSIDNNNRITSFDFNGKSNLTVGGVMKVTHEGATPVEYTYKKEANGEYKLYDNGNEIGNIVRNEQQACYTITIDGVAYTTYIRNEFIGAWAMSGEFKNDVFVIGATDLNGKIHATFQGINVLIEELATDYYSFYCEIDGMPITYYMYALYNYDDNGEKTTFDGFALSEYTNLVNGEYILCSPIDPMKGTWVQNDNPSFTISFDGVQSAYSNGTATLSFKGYPTLYSYRIYKDERGNVESVMLWSQGTYDNKTLYYKLTPTDVTTKGAFVLGNKAYIRSEIDALYKMSATGLDGYTYSFDGGNTSDATWGVITATKQGQPTKTFQYDIVSFNLNNTATITVKGADNKERTLIIDYSDSSNVKIYDELYNVSVTDENGYTYVLNGGNYDENTWGKMTATKSGEKTRTLTYLIVSNDEKNNVITLTVKETVNDVETVYTATFTYGGDKEASITFEKQA